jgi:hypothetical protein
LQRESFKTSLLCSGNYTESLRVAERIIQDEFALFGELDAADMPAFTLVFISDGKPSDNLPQQTSSRIDTMFRIAQKLKSKLFFLGMGIGSRDTDFRVMQQLADLVKHFGAEGTFVHAGLNPVSISTTFSSIAT